MKKLLIVASALAITACSQAEDADADAMADDTTAEAAAPIAADGNPTPGMYKVTDSDGQVYMENVKADGTYETTKDGELYRTGRWEQPSPEQYCSATDEEYREEDDDGSMGCSTEQIGEDGVWTSVNDEGETVTVERADG